MITLGSSNLTQNDLENIVFHQETIGIDAQALKKIERVYDLIQAKSTSKTALYGINTGFGALAEHRVSEKNRAMLQRNIILSHAVGVGLPLSPAEARLMMVLRLNTLVQGYSGASPQMVDALLRLTNSHCAPYVPERGSVGASGDLAPLAHLGLLLLGIGPAFVNGTIVNAQEALAQAGLQSFNLGVRDGLALINGTQAMASRGAMALAHCSLLLHLADICGASTLDAVGGHLAPFDARIQAIKSHPGQIATAENIRRLCQGRKVSDCIENARTQDAYSLRCIPQVHGASKDALAHASAVINRELNGVTDNPLIFIDEEAQDLSVLSGGNFHGQSLALALDYMAMAVAELANIAERRIEQLLNPHHNNGLPAFLTADCGLNSGYMMLHVTASSLVNENKILCHPACTDSIPTSANREDHVSMGMTSANKLIRVIDNTTTVLAIELLAAHQALGFRKPHCAGHKVQEIARTIRSIVPFRAQDGLYIEDLTKLLSWLHSRETHIFFYEILRK